MQRNGTIKKMVCGRPRRTKNEMEKYLLKNRKIHKNGCWEFLGNKLETGYGRVGFQGKFYGAHRLSAYLYLDFNLESKLLICHHCDNTSCFNPYHLFIGPDKENVQDSIKKGRWMSEKRKIVLKKKRKLTEKQALTIIERGKRGEKHGRIAKDFPVSRRTVSKIIQGIRWTYLSANPSSFR